MLTRRHFRLRSLGQLSLTAVTGDSETPAEVRPRHLAVLTVLALSRRPVPRDSLVEMFWGGEAESRARHSLSNALSGLRGLLGADAITARRDQVSLDAEAMLEVDVLQFVAACEARDDRRAVSLYAGSLLAGVHVADAPEFDRWVARERGRLERYFLEVCERRLPELLRASEWAAAASLSERWLDAAPRSATPFIALLRAQAGAGTPVGLTAALSTFDRVRQSLFDGYGLRPDATVVALAGRLRGELADKERASSLEPQATRPLAEPPSEISNGTAPASVAAPSARRNSRLTATARGRWLVGSIAAAVAVVAITGFWARRRTASAAASDHPIVAVTTIDDVRGDTSIAWLCAGLPRMIAVDLSAMGAVEVVAPVRVREVLIRLAGSPTPQITQDQASDVARRLGASWVVTGGVSAASGGYLLDVTLRRATGNGEAETFVIGPANPIDLGQLAATRLASLLNVARGGSAPRYSGVETTSPDAYRHFMRGMLAGDADRWLDAAREFDAAIALDSGFVVAERARAGVATVLGDLTLTRRLNALAGQHAARLPEFDRLSDEIRNLDSLGEHARAAALAEQLIKRFPHDPRAYGLRADILGGNWAAAESVVVRELALDSLAIAAGDGPCTPCDVYRRLSAIRLAKGDRVGAEAAARRWVALQPDLPATWRNLSSTLAAVGQSAEAIEAGFHYVALSNDAPALAEFGRTMIAARHPEIADSLIRTWRGTTDPVLADASRDLQSVIERERGQFSAALRTLSDLPPTNGLILVRADCLARLGRMAEARRIFESTGHPPGSSPAGQFNPSEARGFTWSHALEADALARAGDTTAARVLVDSLEKAGKQSYYGRDWILHHHVRGMLFAAEGRYVDAERELRQAEWAAGGWTRTNIELARAQLAQRHADAAISTLRDAYTAPVDAMGRYVTRSELDWWLSRAFAAASQRDSALKYAAFVREAWTNADPPVRALLDSLPK